MVIEITRSYYVDMSIEITQPTPDDAKGIITVLYKTWLATYPNDVIGITMDDIEDSYKDAFSDERIQRGAESIKNIPLNQKRLIAKDGDTVVGMATMVRNELNNQLRTMYVLPEYQGRGLGTKLWQNVKEFIDPTKDTIVHVADYNLQAINFYKKIGFIDTGKRFSDERFKMKNGVCIPEMEMILRK